MNASVAASLGAALFLGALCSAPAVAHPLPVRPVHGLDMRREPLKRGEGSPWVEGVTPSLENQLFDDTYKVLPRHNVLKVYVFDAAGYQSAGIRFSARVPHELEDLSDGELTHEAASLIRTTFEQFPQLQTLDVWATIPVSNAQAKSIDSTVFSVSADRSTYESIKDDQTLDDEQFVAAFGRVWVDPQVPQ